MADREDPTAWSPWATVPAGLGAEAELMYRYGDRIADLGKSPASRAITRRIAEAAAAGVDKEALKEAAKFTTRSWRYGGTGFKAPAETPQARALHREIGKAIRSARAAAPAPAAPVPASATPPATPAAPVNTTVKAAGEGLREFAKRQVSESGIKGLGQGIKSAGKNVWNWGKTRLFSSKAAVAKGGGRHGAAALAFQGLEDTTKGIIGLHEASGYATGNGPGAWSRLNPFNWTKASKGNGVNPDEFLHNLAGSMKGFVSKASFGAIDIPHEEYDPKVHSAVGSLPRTLAEAEDAALDAQKMLWDMKDPVKRMYRVVSASTLGKDSDANAVKIAFDNVKSYIAEESARVQKEFDANRDKRDFEFSERYEAEIGDNYGDIFTEEDRDRLRTDYENKAREVAFADVNRMKADFVKSASKSAGFREYLNTAFDEGYASGLKDEKTAEIIRSGRMPKDDSEASNLYHETKAGALGEGADLVDTAMYLAF